MAKVKQSSMLEKELKKEFEEVGYVIFYRTPIDSVVLFDDNTYLNYDTMKKSKLPVDYKEFVENLLHEKFKPKLSN